MAFNEILSNRIREALADLPNVTEKYMFGGVCYMLDNKMCIGVVKDDMICRIDPRVYEQVLELPGCREMDFNDKPMKGYVYVDEFGLKTKQQFDYWVGLCIDFNKQAKASKKTKA